MTVELSEKMSELLGNVKASKFDKDDYDVRMQLGTLKRYGLVSLERGEKGEKWSLTDEGKAFLKGEDVSTPPAEAEPGADAEPDE